MEKAFDVFTPDKHSIHVRIQKTLCGVCGGFWGPEVCVVVFNHQCISTPDFLKTTMPPICPCIDKHIAFTALSTCYVTGCVVLQTFKVFALICLSRKHFLEPC